MQGSSRSASLVQPEIAAAVDRVCKALEAESENPLYPWLQAYVAKHRERITQDAALCVSMLEAEGSILDCGSFPFITPLALQSLGFDVRAVDLAPERLQKVLDDSRLRVFRTDLEQEKLPFGDSEFDLILLAEVFEHLRIDLVSTFEELRRVLKPGGTLVLSTVNPLSFRKLARLLLRRRTSPIYEQYLKLRTLGHMGHVREYTAEDVKEFARRLHFSCEKTLYRGVQGWSLSPPALLGSLVNQVVPSSRRWYTLVLRKQAEPRAGVGVAREPQRTGWPRPRATIRLPARARAPPRNENGSYPRGDTTRSLGRGPML